MKDCLQIVQELRDQIEKMKCCENCENNPKECYYQKYDEDCYPDKKHWRLKE